MLPDRRRVGREIRKRRRDRERVREACQALGVDPLEWQIDWLIAWRDGRQFWHFGGRRGGQSLVRDLASRLGFHV